MLESLHALSSFYKGNTLEARRSLRSDLEGEGLRVAQTFIGEFGDLEAQFQSLADSIDALRTGCTDVKDRLEATEARTARFLSQAGQLRSERQLLDSRAHVVGSFLGACQLSDTEKRALYTAPVDAEAGKPFFDALQRVDRIRTDSKALISSAHQAAGLEIMEDMAKHQEAAYERLFQWVQDRCQEVARGASGGDGGGDGDGDGDVQPVLRSALRVLTARPAYYRTCQDCVASTRRAGLVRRFIDALTHGGPGGFPRPIEVHAHDPLRYAGDMLAWVHQAIATEREVLVGLFGQASAGAGAGAGAGASASTTTSTHARPAPDDNVSAVVERKDGDVGGGDAADDEDGGVIQPEELLDRVFEGIVRPLQLRLDQTVQAQSNVVTLFKLLDVMNFYAGIVAGLLRRDRGLGKALLATTSDGDKRFHGLVKQHATRLLQSAGPYPATLMPSREVVDTLNRLEDILQVYGRSMVPAEEREDGLAPVLSQFLDPLLHVARQSAEGLGLSDTSVFMLNNITAMQAVLTPHDFTASWVQRLAAEMQQWEDTLVREEANDMLSRTGLLPKLRAVESHGDDDGPLSAVPGLAATDLRPPLKALYATLFSLAMPSFDRLASPRLRVRARRGTALLVAAAYDTVYNAVTDARHAYPDAADLVPHPPNQVRTLLDLDAAE